jgi:hypothetical protein
MNTNASAAIVATFRTTPKAQTSKEAKHPITIGWDTRPAAFRISDSPAGLGLATVNEIVRQSGGYTAAHN